MTNALQAHIPDSTFLRPRPNADPKSLREVLSLACRGVSVTNMHAKYQASIFKNVSSRPFSVYFISEHFWPGQTDKVNLTDSKV